MTDKKLLSTVRSRVQALRKQELTKTDVYMRFMNQVRTFNLRHNYNDFNIHFSKKMSVEERREMRRILNQFYKSPESTKTGIVKKYSTIFKNLKSNINIKKLKGDELSYMIKQVNRVKEASEKWYYDIFGGETTKDVFYNAKSNDMKQDDVIEVFRDVAINYDVAATKPSKMTNYIIDLLGHRRRGETKEYESLLKRGI